MNYTQFYGIKWATRLRRGKSKNRAGSIFVVSNENIQEIARYLFSLRFGCRLSTATAQRKEPITCLGNSCYHFFARRQRLLLIAHGWFLTDKKNPKGYYITDIVTGALWIEREIFDLWGIEFSGHPRMEQLLTLNSPENPDRPLRFGRSL